MTHEDELCSLTGRRCPHLRRFNGRCSDAPSADDAAKCIALSAEEIHDLRNELGAMDEWVDTLREQLNQPPPKTEGQ